MGEKKGRRKRLFCLFRIEAKLEPGEQRTQNEVKLIETREAKRKKVKQMMQKNYLEA
jgi:hypothetical protein